MKQTVLLIAIMSSIFLASCKKNNVQDAMESEDISVIKKVRDQRQKEVDKLRSEIKQLEERIEALDTTKQNYALVTAINVQDTSFEHFVQVQGSVKTKDDTHIYPEMAGQMTRLYVQEGEYVKRGQLIATVDDGGLKQQIAQQEVQLQLARTTFERQERLWEQNIGSEMQYLEAKNRVEALEEGIAAMRQQLKKVNVYAPFNGAVEEVITQQGQVVSPGATPIIRLVGLGSRYVEAEVPETYLQSIDRGTKTIVTLDAIDYEYNSTVKRVNSTINPASRSFIIEVGVPNNRLIKPNLIANLKMNDYTNDEAILIPLSVINEDAEGNQFVFVVDKLMDEQQNTATVKRVSITTGKNTGDGMIEVLEGLETNQQLISEGAKVLEDGQTVTLMAL